MKSISTAILVTLFASMGFAKELSISCNYNIKTNGYHGNRDNRGIIELQGSMPHWRRSVNVKSLTMSTSESKPTEIYDRSVLPAYDLEKKSLSLKFSFNLNGEPYRVDFEVKDCENDFISSGSGTLYTPYQSDYSPNSMWDCYCALK